MMAWVFRHSILFSAAITLLVCTAVPAAAQNAGDAAPTEQYIALLREEARRADSVEFAPQVRRRWQYVAALSPNDQEAAQRIRELNAEIASRAGGLVDEGDAEMRRGRAQPARLLFLRALALDGSNVQARSQLAELDRRAQLARQDRANQQARAAAAAEEAAEQSANRLMVPELLRAPPQQPSPDSQ